MTDPVAIVAPPVADLIRSLRSHTCPACADRKRQMHTFCGRCYFRLPVAMQKRMWNRVGKGYEPAVEEAMRELGATRFFMPGETPDPARSGADTARNAQNSAERLALTMLPGVEP